MANFPTQVPDQDVSAYEQWQLDQHVQDLDRERRDEQAQSQQDAAAQAQQTAAELRRFSPFDDVFRKYAGPLAGNDEFISILAAGTKAESGWNPNATGDNGHSIGIFQMHDQGAGAGLSRDQRADPDTASAHMVPRYVAAYQQAKAQNPNLGGPELASLVAAMAERPLGWDNPQSAARRGYASAYGDVMGGKAPPVAVPPAILNPNQTSSSDFLDYVQGLDQQRQAVQREAGANQFQDFVRELDQRRRQMLGDTSPRPGLGMDVGGDLFGGLASRMAPRQSGVMDPRGGWCPQV